MPALFAALTTAICATPVAWAAPGLQAIYLLPLGFGWWVVRNRTTVDEERLVARGTFGRRVIAWSEVSAIKVVARGWLSARLADGSLVRLPAVRAGHLPALSVVSGGRVPDPSAPEPDEAAPDETDATASDRVEDAAPAGTTPDSTTPDAPAGEKPTAK